MKRVLFVCTANSARSQMAEALLRHFAGDQFDVFSAGTHPTQVDPRTIQAMEEFGLPTTSLESKSVDSISHLEFDFVISLCDKAHAECQNWPGKGVIMSWDFPDPKESDNPKAFAITLQELSERIRLFVLVNKKDVESSIRPVTAIDFFKSLADETRLLSLLLIQQEKELCVCELMEALDQSQPKISRHLSQLRKSGLLMDRRQGQWVFYKIHPLLNDWMKEILENTRQHSQKLLETPESRLKKMPARPSLGGNACHSGENHEQTV